MLTFTTETVMLRDTGAVNGAGLDVTGRGLYRSSLWQQLDLFTSETDNAPMDYRYIELLEIAFSLASGTVSTPEPSVVLILGMGLLGVMGFGAWLKKKAVQPFRTFQSRMAIPSRSLSCLGAMLSIPAEPELLVSSTTQ
jgi:hypothetical protein